MEKICKYIEYILRITKSKNTSSWTSIYNAMAKNKKMRDDLERILKEKIPYTTVKYFLQLDSKVFKSISSMCHGRGMPSAEEIRKFLSIPELQNKEGEVNIEILKSISSMCSGRGMPSAEEVQKFLSIAEVNRNGQINIEILKSISSMCHGRGMPSAEEIRKFLSIPELQNKEGGINIEILKSISSMCSTKGMPSAEEIRKFLRFYNSIEQYHKEHLQKYAISLRRYRYHILREYRGNISSIPEKHIASTDINALMQTLHTEDDRILSKFEKILLGTYKKTPWEQRRSQDAMNHAVSSDIGWDDPDTLTTDISDDGAGDPSREAENTELYTLLAEYGFTVDDFDAIIDPDHENHAIALQKIRTNEELMEALRDFL